MSRRSTGQLLVLGLGLVLGIPRSMADAPRNLLVNPGFEQAAGRKVPGWYTSAADARGEVAPDHTLARTGQVSMRLRATAPRLRTAQMVAVSPDTTYRISGWIRTENVEQAEIRVIRNLKREGKPYLNEVGVGSVSGTRDWSYVEALFGSGDGTHVSVWLWMPGGRGTAWFDDVCLEPDGQLKSVNLLRNSTFTVWT